MYNKIFQGIVELIGRDSGTTLPSPYAMPSTEIAAPTPYPVLPTPYDIAVPMQQQVLTSAILPCTGYTVSGTDLLYQHIPLAKVRVQGRGSTWSPVSPELLLPLQNPQY